MKQILALALSVVFLFAGDIYETTKESCIQQSNYSGKKLSELKNILISQSKRDAVEELYGNLILSKTNITNGKLISDEIKSKAVGAIRIKGNPKFYNGKDFGEICSNITAYITKKDLKKYSPKEVKLKHFCFNDSSVATKDIKQKAKEAAYREIITTFKPELKNISLSSAEKFVHEFRISNDKFDFSTASYCFDVVGSVFPYELEISDKSNFTANLNGLYVSFYDKNDYQLTNEIYSTKLSKNLSLFKHKFTNKTIKKNRAYYIRISGFLYSNRVRHMSLKLISDVNRAYVKINDRTIVSKDETMGGITLNNGYNKLEIVLLSSNDYDIKLLEKVNGTYIPIKLKNLTFKEKK